MPDEALLEGSELATELYREIQAVRNSSALGPFPGLAKTHVVAIAAWIGNGSLQNWSHVAGLTVGRNARMSALLFLGFRVQVSAAHAKTSGSWFHVTPEDTSVTASGRRPPTGPGDDPKPDVRTLESLEGDRADAGASKEPPGTGDWCGEAVDANLLSISRRRWLLMHAAIQAVGLSLGESSDFNTMDLRFLCGISRMRTK